MKSPTSKNELQTVLGMANYLAKFAPHLSDITAPLRDLLQDSSAFLWDAQQEKALAKLKEVITTSPTLAFFDPSKDVTLQVDASERATGAVLMQDGKPVEYASKALGPSQRNYAPIEREMLAIVHGCHRFKQFLYGRRVTVESDHRPLQYIFRKPLTAVPKRLQSMMLELQRYNYDINIVHKPGKDIPVADCLSRNPIAERTSTQQDDFENRLDVAIHHLIAELPVTDNVLEKIRSATATDMESQLLKRTIISGWPDRKKDCPIAIIGHWNHRDDMSVAEGLIFKGTRIVIPAPLRKDILLKIHAGHLGIEKCKERARSSVFWPGIGVDIEKAVKECSTCQMYQASNIREPMIPHPTPALPWQNIATDIMTLYGHDYLVVVDYYSNYPEIERLKDTTASSVINKLKSILARHGRCQTLVSDNGPQYASKEFAKFAQEWDFKHITSSPHHQQGNGLAERTIRTLKQLMKKAKEEHTDPYASLLELRNTPVRGHASPAQLLMSRRLRSAIPATQKLLRPKVVAASLVEELAEKKQQSQKQTYDRPTRELQTLQEGEHVRFKMSPKSAVWEPAQVISQDVTTPRSYIIRSNDHTYRRNRAHILKIPQPGTPKPEPSNRHVETPKLSATPTSPKKDRTLSATPSSCAPPTPAGKMNGTDEFYMTRAGRASKPRRVLDL